MNSARVDGHTSKNRITWRNCSYRQMILRTDNVFLDIVVTTGS